MEKNQYEIYHENKKHTPNDFPYNTYLCSIPLDFKSVNLHWHNEVELIVIKKGQGLVNVNLVTYTVNAGDVVFVFPGQLHSISQKIIVLWNMKIFFLNQVFLNLQAMICAMTSLFNLYFQEI